MVNKKKDKKRKKECLSCVENAYLYRDFERLLLFFQRIIVSTISRVIFQYISPQFCFVNMGINLGSTDIFMSQHHTYGLQVSSPFKQMGREAMPKGVGTYLFGNTRHRSKLFDKTENRYA